MSTYLVARSLVLQPPGSDLPNFSLGFGFGFGVELDLPAAWQPLLLSLLLPLFVLVYCSFLLGGAHIYYSTYLPTLLYL